MLEFRRIIGVEVAPTPSQTQRDSSGSHLNDTWFTCWCFHFNPELGQVSPFISNGSVDEGGVASCGDRAVSGARAHQSVSAGRAPARASAWLRRLVCQQHAEPA